MEKRLSDLVPGDVCTVKAVTGEGRVRRRLFDMGITPDAEIVVKKRAPLGDPVEVTVRGYELSLRRSEAEYIIVTGGAR